MIPVLITFPPSLDSETARFLVAHYAIESIEERHTLIFSFFVTFWHGFTPIFPLLYSNSYRLAGPRPIVDHFDPQSPPEIKLLPDDPNDLSQVNSDWTLFNSTLAFATAKFAYYYLLPHRALMINPLSQGTPPFEQNAVISAYPVFAGLLRLLLQLSLSTAQKSVAQVRTIFNAVDARLADGRKYLVGGRFSLSDLAFAVAAAPVVLPSGYGGPIPTYDQMPPEVQAVVTEMRGHPAGAFALRIYNEQRYPSTAAAAH
ncbi:MAG TPA: glutathione S-transferase C-terminal domain-containing protein [Candidatus Sulfotelmatobacter sp.]